MKTDYDVIVLGGGGSGLAAAVSAAENGAHVVLVEKNPRLGGTTGIAIGCHGPPIVAPRGRRRNPPRHRML
ncbi:MAG TPA: FAD-dependent oxidoreductase [Thermoguttaceae bacterium]|nr:FAD-dependent oxidoreductase [Thermoguttaceae bacterium]